MGKGARWVVGLAVICALIVGAWWLLQDRTDSAATRGATAVAPAAPGAPPTAEAAPDLPTPTESVDAKLLAAAPQAAAVPLPAGERRESTVAPARGLRIAGYVLDPAHKPLAEASVELRSVDPEEGLTRMRYPPEVKRPDARTDSAADGSFAFEDLKPGDWTVSASAPGFATAKFAVTLKDGAPVENVVLVLQPSGAIAGVVLRGGQPVAGAFVAALSVAQAEAIHAVEKAKGFYNLRLDHLEKDVHQAKADAQGRFHLNDLSTEPFELTGPPGVYLVVEVRAGETAEVTLEERAKPHVRGHVAGPQGPVSGAAINADLYLDAGDIHAWSTSSPVAHSDADGNFEAELDMPGRYRFNAELAKKHSNGVELNLDWDQDQWVELQLPSGS